MPTRTRYLHTLLHTCYSRSQQRGLAAEAALPRAGAGCSQLFSFCEFPLLHAVLLPGSPMTHHPGPQALRVLCLLPTRRGARRSRPVFSFARPATRTANLSKLGPPCVDSGTSPGPPDSQRKMDRCCAAQDDGWRRRGVSLLFSAFWRLQAQSAGNCAERPPNPGAFQAPMGLCSPVHVDYLRLQECEEIREENGQRLRPALCTQIRCVSHCIFMTRNSNDDDA